MKDTIVTHWQENLKFDSQIGKHSLLTDAPESAGGNDTASSPKKLMMVALAGCTGIDVVTILKKMRVAFTSLAIRVEAELTDEAPSVYKAMHLIYEFQGKDLDVAKLRKAIALSQDKYCGVSMMYRQIMTITWEVKY
jgi:putative redox protein